MFLKAVFCPSVKLYSICALCCIYTNLDDFTGTFKLNDLHGLIII